MTYLDTRISRKLAFCALALFSVTCLLELTEVVQSGRMIIMNQEFLLLFYNMDRPEYFFILASAKTLRAIAILHGTTVILMLAVFLVIVRAYVLKPSIIKAALIAGVLAFLPVTQVAEQGARLVVDAFQGEGAYVRTMSRGDGKIQSSNRGVLKEQMYLTVSALEIDRSAHLQDFRWDEENKEAGKNFAIRAAYRAISYLSDLFALFGIFYDITFYATAGLLFAWSSRHWVMERRWDWGSAETAANPS